MILIKVVKFVQLTRITLLKVMKVEGYIIFLWIFILANSSCYSRCLTCINPNNSTYRYYCTSCHSNHFLFTDACYSCQYCQNYGMCKQCGISSDRFSSCLLISAITAILALVVLLICCCRKMRCRTRDDQADGQELEIHMSQNRLVLGTPSQTYQWKKALTKFNMDQQCPICLDSQVFLQTNCHHSSHPKCLLMQIKKGGNCPLCKSKILNPVKIYCTQCFEEYVEIDLMSLQGVCDGNWKRCPSCKQLH